MSLKQFSLNGLTLSIAPSSEHAGFGRVFLEVAGLRFGQDSVDEELDLFFYAAFNGFKSLSGVYPHLMNISSEQYRSLVNSVYDRCYSPVLFGEADGDVLVESTILRMEMAFDETLIGVFFKPGSGADSTACLLWWRRADATSRYTASYILRGRWLGGKNDPTEWHL